MDKALQLAHAIKLRHNFISVQSLGRIFIFRDGFYQTIKSPKCDADLHMIVMEDSDGRKITSAKRDQVIRNLEILCSRKEEDLNPENIFNFKDCLVDIVSGQTIPHSPDALTTVQLPYAYKSREAAPLWRKFLHDVTAGCPEKQALLQEFAGYCLMKSCHLEKALFLFGRGSNGKSVFSETLAKVFGRHNVSAVSLEGLSNPVHRCNILGKYLNIDSDLPRNAEKFEESFRKIVSGEPVLFNEKFIPAFSAAPYCKLIYCLNEFPIIDDASNAFYRRMLLVPFNVEFNAETKDVNLKKKLEDELPGIFRWCVEGYKQVRDHGFSTNQFMNDQIHELKADNNPIIAFAEEELEFVKHGEVTKRDLYESFKNWTARNGHKPPSFRKFNNRFYMEFRGRVDDGRAGKNRDHSWINVEIKGAHKSSQQDIDFQE